MKSKTNKVIMLCLTALFTALIAVGAYIKIPAFPVPATSRILDMDRLSPYCFEIVARQAAPQSVISCCFTQ